MSALLGELGCEIEGWPTERVRAVLRSERYFYAINYLRAITIHPLNYALALAAAAERDGARIFENTPALSIDPTGVRKRIVTPGARLRANHVVLCGNVQLGPLMPRLAATLLPVTTYVITTAPLGDALAEAVGYRGGVSDTDLADNHYRIVGGDRLMLSGRSTAWLRDPRHYVGALTADIKRTYPQLGDVDVDYAWAGTLGITDAPHAADRRTWSRASGSPAASAATVSTPRPWPATSSRAPSSMAIRPGDNSRRSNWSGRAACSAARRRRCAIWIKRLRDASTSAAPRRANSRIVRRATPRWRERRDRSAGRSAGAQWREQDPATARRLQLHCRRPVARTVPPEPASEAGNILAAARRGDENAASTGSWPRIRTAKA